MLAHGLFGRAQLQQQQQQQQQQVVVAPFLFYGVNPRPRQFRFVPRRTFSSKGPALGGGDDDGTKGPAPGSSKNNDGGDDVEPKKSPWVGRLVTLGAGVSLLAGKSKYLLVALKVTKLAPLASMVVSSLAYATLFGPLYGVGMVGLIFVHECGHAAAMKHYGYLIYMLAVYVNALARGF
jgi:hypothetical protein